MSAAPDPAERVYVVDDDDAMRDSLVWLLGSRGLTVEPFASAEAFLAASPEHMRGCLVLDVRMPGMSGLELHDHLVARGVRLPVVFITGHGDVPMAVSALKKGAADFIEKPFAEAAMMELVLRCLETDRQRRASEDQGSVRRARLASLTLRERQVMELVLDGKLNKQVADELGISVKTVEIHRARVMAKMRAGSVAELVREVLAARGEGVR